MAIELKGETFLNVEESAVESGRAKNTVYQLYKQWGWTAYSFGPNILFKQSEIQNWLEQQIKP